MGNLYGNRILAKLLKIKNYCSFLYFKIIKLFLIYLKLKYHFILLPIKISLYIILNLLYFQMQKIILDIHYIYILKKIKLNKIE